MPSWIKWDTRVCIICAVIALAIDLRQKRVAETWAKAAGP